MNLAKPVVKRRSGPRVLVVATKAPWPPVDGGRLLLWNTLSGLAAAGVPVTLVAPVDPRRHPPEEVQAALRGICEPVLVAARPTGMVRAVWRSLPPQGPLSIARHRVGLVRRRVEEVLAAGRFDVVHAEQLQALPQVLAPAGRSRLPVVLRAQNVESALWVGAGGGVLSWEARRLEGWEGDAVGRAAATVALTAVDATALRRLAAAAGAPRARVIEVAAPFESNLPSGPSLAGAPPVTLLGSRGWRPNEDAVEWFAGEIWSAIRAALPDARLHIFGIGRPNTRHSAASPAEAAAAAERDPILWHGAPDSSAAAFAAGSVHVVPLRLGSGVRMKILEAWARGVPVISTPEGASGLEASDGVDLLLAADAAAFAAALRRIHEDPSLAADLVRGGRATLARRHDPAQAASRLLTVYEDVLRA